MKSFIDKFISKTSRFEFLLLLVPFILWIYCFQNFFNGHFPLFEDAISYRNHICYYAISLSHGIYPLWDPTWCYGAPNDFFLRRIGDVNPLLFLMVSLIWLGVAPAGAYLILLGVYYFLAGWAFYLIARFLLVDRFYAFSAYVLFLFSSWGSEIFYNYIIIIFVPIIWFFYFLLSFSRKPKKAYLLGMCLCMGLVVTTYIPFFFLTMLAVFGFFYILFYGKEFLGLFENSLVFVLRNKIFISFCIIFLLASCIPGLIFYKESKSGDFVLPGRHTGADVSSAVAVGMEGVTSGDLISHGYFDRIFDDQAHLDMGDIYIPYFFFLILLTTVCARVNKLIFFLLFNILVLLIVTITSASGVHRFLYEHIIIFKFIRNIYYFFWLAVLPMGILLAVSAFKSLLTAIDHSSKKKMLLIYIILCHLVFVLFLLTRQGVLGGAWAAVAMSLLFFVCYVRNGNIITRVAAFGIILTGIFIQSTQVYELQDKKLVSDTREYAKHNVAAVNPVKTRMGLYYASTWFAILVKYIDPQVLDTYLSHQFIFYDSVAPYMDSPVFFNSLQSAMSSGADIAFVSKLDSKPVDWRENHVANGRIDTDPVASGKLSVINSDSNTWYLKTKLSEDRFLVINDNYNVDWYAFINNRPARLIRANVSFKGLWVPSGESNIVLRFSTSKRYVLHYFLIILFAGTFLYLLFLLTKVKRTKLYG